MARDLLFPARMAVMELICIGVSIAFVVATWGLVALCARLQEDER